jgi:hypothetical protein
MKLNLFSAAIAILLACITAPCYSQSGLQISQGIALAKDSAIITLISSLNGFLLQKEKPNKENAYVLKEDLLETSALLDELKGIEQDAKLKDAGFYKPYVTTVLKQDENNYIVQLCYIGITDGSPMLRANIKLLAKKGGSKFYFYSPLKQNTANWKIKQTGKVTFHYKKELNANDVKQFIKTVNLYDEKLKADKPIDQYYSDNFLEAQQLLGLEYKADYAGVINNNLTANENNTSLIINGWCSGQNRFDPHDLFHDRLRTVMASDVINRPVDEGCAYLYGGSWGFTWAQILVMFKKYVTENQNADWLQLYIDGKNFADDNGRILKASYVMNALIVQKLEKEKVSRQ